MADASLPTDVPPPALGDSERQALLHRYAEIATLAGGLAHEVRNPLSTVGLNLELLEEELGEADSPRDRRMLSRLQLVRRECDRLENILNDFLQFARLGELELEETDLNAEVDAFIEFFRPQAENAGVEISPHLALDLPAVLLDRTLFQQVLMNLARNALDAMPKGGRLEVQTVPAEGMVRLDLIDTGEGMKPAVVEKIFRAFYSTKKGGSGLGLPTVRKIVNAHGGTIGCESEVGRGTRFSVRLPVAANSPTDG